ncbi:MAG: hypothetical protein JJU29_13160 [Verrucomicrobia bacterium]|nr:hypothetical protein [Verrucomicrobiota bacterium]
MSDSDNNPVHRKKAFPPEISRFIDIQAKELEIRQAELNQAQIADEHAHVYALEALRLQAQSDSETRTHIITDRDKTRRWIAIILLIFVLFFGWAIHNDKEEIVIEIIKIGSAFLFGGAGGYGLAKKRESREN